MTNTNENNVSIESLGTIQDGRFYLPQWRCGEFDYFCWRNSEGHWWAFEEGEDSSGRWYRVALNDAMSFRALRDAIAFIETHRIKAEK